MVLSVHEGNDPAEDHVDGGSKQGWGNQEKCALDNIRPQSPIGGLVAGHRSTDIAHRFNWRRFHRQFCGLAERLDVEI